MGLGPMNAIYQAQFNKYLHNRGIKDTSQQHVWAFLGDGEMDEPESRGLLQLAAERGARQPHLRHQLQPAAARRPGARQRQDHPGARGVLPRRRLERHQGRLGPRVGPAARPGPRRRARAPDEHHERRRLPDLPRQRRRRTSASTSSAATRAPARWSRTGPTTTIWWKLKRGGHDYRKVFAAYQAAMNHTGQPTVILAKTIKGYGLGAHFAGRNATHQMKKLTLDDLKTFRDGLRIPISDEQLEADPYRPPYYHPGAGRRGDPVPARAPARRSAGRAAAPRPARARSSCRATRPTSSVEEGLRQAADRHDDGVRPAAQGPHARQGVRRARRADHPGRGAHLRHGLVLPDDQDLQPARAELHLGRRAS